MLMSGSGPSLLSLIASALYLPVIVACVLAARGRGQASDGRGWWWLALLFSCLIAWRIAGAEDFVREGLREGLRANDLYLDRRAIQWPIAIALGLVGVGLIALMARRILAAEGRRARLLAFAQMAGAAMMSLILFRLLSLSAIDYLLYGPAKLNWFLDLGLALAVFLCALNYRRLTKLKR